MDDRGRSEIMAVAAAENMIGVVTAGMTGTGGFTEQEAGVMTGVLVI
jgi:hypothetical protein